MDIILPSDEPTPEEAFRRAFEAVEVDEDLPVATPSKPLDEDEEEALDEDDLDF